MNGWLIVLLYLAYAYGQAVLIVWKGFRKDSEPGWTTLALMTAAPAVTLVVLVGLFVGFHNRLLGRKL